MEVFGEVAETYLEFAEEAAGQSPCFEEWASAVPPVVFHSAVAAYPDEPAVPSSWT
jgi:hypothetical protein